MEVTTAFGPVSVLTVSGAIDAATFSELLREADEVVSSAHANLVLDLGGVDFVSSGGLVALQSIATQAASCGGKMVLCCVGKRVAGIFRMTGFDTMLEIYSDVEAAKASFH